MAGEKRRPGDPDPTPDTRELDEMANVARYGTAPGAGGLFGNPGQPTVTERTSSLLRWWRARRKKRAAIEAWRQKRAAEQGDPGTPGPGE